MLQEDQCKPQEAKDAGMVYDVVPAEELDDPLWKLVEIC